MSDEEMQEMEKINKELDELRLSQKEEIEANQEAYYWHCLQEFHAILKVFGQTKVLGDLKKIKDQIDGVQEKPRIIIAH